MRRSSCILLAIVLGACSDEPPQQAPGFAAANLNRLSIGMTTAEILKVMGEPLPDLNPGSRERALFYARPGARWYAGEYRSNVRGYECILWLKEGRLLAARVFDAEAGVICECKAEPCSSGWAAPCMRPKPQARGEGRDRTADARPSTTQRPAASAAARDMWVVPVVGRLFGRSGVLPTVARQPPRGALPRDTAVPGAASGMASASCAGPRGCLVRRESAASG
jgi:hypothetical protein